MLKAPQDYVVSLLDTAGVRGMVSPTSAPGWTAAWAEPSADQEPDLSGHAAFVMIDETPSGARVVLRDDAGQLVTLGWPHRDGDALPAMVATRLASMFGPADRVAQVEELLSDADHDADSLTEALERLLDLPPLVEPDPETAIVACRGDLALIRMASSIAGPVWLGDAGAGWTVVRPAHDGEVDATPVAAAVSGGGRRRDRALLLWRAGAASGVLVWRRGWVEASWSWNGAWREVDPDELATETAACVALAATARSDVHLPTLRALLRRKYSGDDPLPTLAELLGLPTTIVKALDAGGDISDWPGAELVQRASASRAWLTAMRSAQPRPVPTRLRPLYVAYTIGTVTAAVASVAMTVLGVAIIVTDGAVIDQPGTNGEDWAVTAVFAALSLILVPTAAIRIRRVRGAGQRPQTRLEADADRGGSQD